MKDQVSAVDVLSYRLGTANGRVSAVHSTVLSAEEEVSCVCD